MKIIFDGEDFAKKELDLFLTVFNILSKEEQEHFKKFLDSPYFTTKKQLAPLYKRIFDSYRSQQNSGNDDYRISGRPLLKAVELGKMAESRAKTQLKSLLKQLPPLVFEFIEHQEIKTNRRIGDRVKVLALKKRSNSTFFQEAAESFMETLASEPVSLMLYQDQWWLYHQLYFHQYAQQYHERDTLRLVKATHFLRSFYQLASLRHYCEVLNRRKILGEETGFEALTKQIGEFIDEESPIPAIGFYSRFARILQFPGNIQIYERYKAHYQEHFDDLDQVDQLVMIKGIFNICIRNYEAGQENGPRELVFWARAGVDTGVFLFEGSLSDKEYLNITVAAGIAGALDFMKSFLTAYQPHLEESCRERAYQMALTQWYFFQNQLSMVLQLLNEHFPPSRPLDHIYTLRSKVFYLLVYLTACIEEKDQLLDGVNSQDGFHLQMDAYRQYISRANFLDPGRRVPYKRFYDICNRIYQYSCGNPDHQTAANKAAILAEIRSDELLLGRYVLENLAGDLKSR